MKPKNHYSGDERWLKDRYNELCGLCGVKAAMAVLDKYSAAYAEAHSQEPVNHKKDGVARLSANSRLVRYITKLKNKRDAN